MTDTAPDASAPQGRHVVMIATAGLLIPLAIALLALATRTWYPVLDLAMTEIRIRDVGTRSTPLIGLPGRIGDLPDQGSHPGPLSFWLLAPGYRIGGSGPWAMQFSTVLLHGMWSALALWIGHRRGGTIGVASVALGLAVLIRIIGLTPLTQPWNPYLPLIAWVVVLLATWSVLCGDHGMLVPLVLAATFAAQTHIPYLTMAGALGLVAAAAVAVRWFRSDPDEPPRRSAATWLLGTVGIFGVVSIPIALDQIVRSPGNISRLIDHFGDPPEEAIGLVEAVEITIRHFDVVGAFVESFVNSGRFADASPGYEGSLTLGCIFFTVWAASAVVATRSGGQRLRMLHAVIAVGVVASIVSTSRIFGFPWFYLTLWGWAIGLLALAAVIATIVELRPPSAAHRVRLHRAVLAGAVAVTVSTAAIAPWTTHPEERLGDAVGEVLPATIDALREIDEDGRYLVRWRDAASFGSQAMGLISELDRRGFTVGADEFWSVPLTSDLVLAPGTETATLLVATGRYVGDLGADDDLRLVASSDVRTRAEVDEFGRVRTELVDELRSIGMEDAVAAVDGNLFALLIDPRSNDRVRDLTDELLFLGQPLAVFLGDAGIAP